MDHAFRRRKNDQFLDLIQPPTRVFITGQAQSGKTTLAVKIIKRRFIGKVTRVFIVCPNWEDQATFDDIRRFVNDEDVYVEVRDNTFQIIAKKIMADRKKRKAVGLPKPRFLIFIDDVAGLSSVQNRGMGHFANFAVQVTHWGGSIVGIFQQAKRCDPAFRDNAENKIVLYDHGMAPYVWMRERYTALDMNVNDVKRIMLTAWRGGRSDDKERGRHFLFVHETRRGPVRFFIDFDREIPAREDLEIDNE